MKSALLLSLCLIALPAVAAEPTNAELAARIAGLEARMAQLESGHGLIIDRSGLLLSLEA